MCALHEVCRITRVSRLFSSVIIKSLAVNVSCVSKCHFQFKYIIVKYISQLFEGYVTEKLKRRSIRLQEVVIKFLTLNDSIRDISTFTGSKMKLLLEYNYVGCNLLFISDVSSL